MEFVTCRDPARAGPALFLWVKAIPDPADLGRRTGTLHRVDPVSLRMEEVFTREDVRGLIAAPGLISPGAIDFAVGHAGGISVLGPRGDVLRDARFIDEGTGWVTPLFVADVAGDARYEIGVRIWEFEVRFRDAWSTDRVERGSRFLLLDEDLQPLAEHDFRGATTASPVTIHGKIHILVYAQGEGFVLLGS
jgi:hypothetical protein